MTLSDIISSGLLGIAILLTIVQIAPIKIDPWSWIGKAFNKDITQKVERLEGNISNVQDGLRIETEERRKGDIIQCRVRILRFADELANEVHHSKGHFEQILQDAQQYERYCMTHPEFENGLTGPSITHIREVYNQLLREGKFR